MGVWGPARNFSISGTARLDLLDRLIAEGARRGRTFTADPRPEAGSFFRSDHFPFAKAGVPGDQLRARATTSSTAGSRAARRWPPTIPPSAITSPTTNICPSWDFTGIVEDAHCSTRSAATWPIRPPGRTGARTANSARSATAAAASAAAPPPRRPRPPAKGERG